ncbi:MAG: tRNA pseudouridine(38-40) synthase TruA [Myxococcota bacterium]
MGERTLKLTIEYDGTGLVGWQRQKNGLSVQQHIEDAVAAMVGRPTPVQGASRTDAGVHALGQVAHLRTTSTIPCHGFRRGLNTHLPPAIAIVACQEVSEHFHARFSARGKHYRYTVLTRPERSPLVHERAWHRPRPLDTAAMDRAARHMIGERDFSAFRAAGCTAATATRAVTAIAIRRPAPDITPPGLLWIDVRGNAFLRNMVRIMAGTLVAVGEGRLAADDIPTILTNRDRTRAGQTAPARGLTLMRVFYDPSPNGPEPGDKPSP